MKVRDRDLANVVRRMKSAGMKVAVAESCTGGMLGSMMTSVPGSSEWFAGGVIAYSNAVKSGVLGVGRRLIRSRGAVSAECAAAMASGVRKLIRADIGISLTGIAGPGGGSAGKPVGLVYVGLDDGRVCRAERHLFAGARKAVREKSCLAALKMLNNALGVVIVPRRGTKGR